MATRIDMMDWVHDEIKTAGGKATILHLAEQIWANHAPEIQKSGKLLYTWQYDMRWAAFELRKQGVLAPTASSPRGTWALK